MKPSVNRTVSEQCVEPPATKLAHGKHLRLIYFRVIWLLVIVSLVAVGYKVITTDRPDAQSKLSAATKPIESGHSTKEPDKNYTVETTSVENENSVFEASGGFEKSAYDLERAHHQWRLSQGLFTWKERAKYDHHDKQAFIGLAEAGDLLANEILRDNAENHPERFKELTVVAAAAGSTEALVVYNIVYDNARIEAKKAGNFEEVRRIQIERLADFEVAMMRGNLIGWIEGSKLIKKYFNGVDGEKLTSDDLSRISELSKSKWEEIEAYRIAKKWPALVNKIDPMMFQPESVEVFRKTIDELQKFKSSPESPLWGVKYLEPVLSNKST